MWEFPIKVLVKNVKTVLVFRVKIKNLTGYKMVSWLKSLNLDKTNHLKKYIRYEMKGKDHFNKNVIREVPVYKRENERM